MNELEINECDIIEKYNTRTLRGIAKYLIVKKIVTKHRGIFFDLMKLPDKNEDLPKYITGMKLNKKHTKFGLEYEYRKFIDDKK